MVASVLAVALTTRGPRTYVRPLAVCRPPLGSAFGSVNVGPPVSVMVLAVLTLTSVTVVSVLGFPARSVATALMV